ncbi:MAG: tycC2, partial [Akkermansiaceae bacterium]|nr:tycC2 [Akkermansiaceae bacterium]
PQLKILCGGEAMDPSLAAELLPLSQEIWNLYGPTETTVWSTLWKLPKKPQAIAIGRPIANTVLDIVAPDGSTVPPGVAGELLIGGAGLAEGYWRRADLTAEKFIIHAGSRFYRTGDLARWRPDGTLDCLGRMDSQVKIRGFRVELGEVETAMLSHPLVAEAAAMVEGPAGESRLIGFYRLTAPLTPAAFYHHLRTCLPEYMAPSRLVVVEAMPLTSSGKIDRRALLARHPADAAPVSTISHPPQGVIEGEVAALWSELLGCGPVGREDDFFALGGHSLLASRMVAQLSQRLALPVALDALFERPTVAALSARIGENIDPALPRAILLHRSEKNAAPMFWMHTLVDGGMGLFPYRRAAALLEGVTSYGIAEGTRPFDSLQEMAAHHVELIRSLQPHGPYRLTGFCFGGNLAAEVASQLAEAGEAIDLLVLLESHPPHAASDLLRWLKPSTWWHLSRRLRQNLPRMRSFDSSMFFRRLRMKHRALTGSLTRISRKECGIPDIDAVLDLSALTEDERERAIQHWSALHHHPTRLPQNTRVAVVRADGDGWLPRSPALGWDRFTAKVEARAVSGRHEEFLRGESADEVAATLSDLLS